MVVLTMWIRKKWRERRVVHALFLNIKSVYPSVYPSRLVHSLGQKGCPTYLWKIIARFLEDRTTRLQLADFLSAEFKLDKGLPQGSPLSVISYISYNSDLLIKNFDFGGDEVSLGFIDDVVDLTVDKSMTGASEKLHALREQLLAWGKSHEAIFDSRKAQYQA
jgi:hypothetical protein